MHDGHHHSPSLTHIIEDQSLLRIVLIKSRRDASNCWKSLLESQYESNFWELDQTEKKLTLERFQNEVGLRYIIFLCHTVLVITIRILDLTSAGQTSLEIIKGEDLN